MFLEPGKDAIQEQHLSLDRLWEGFHGWWVPQLKRQSGKKAGVFGKTIPGIFDLLMSILRGIRYLQSE